MTTAVLTPERRGTLVELGNGRWRKQLLPFGTITYKGRKITFDKAYFSDLVTSFRNRACEAVPLQVADKDNAHTNDPFRRHGTVVDVELAPDGLDAIIELDDEAQKLIKDYPDIGVSARIYENYERSDGNFFKTALQHVLATLDPHVVGMRPWQAVALSNETSVSVIDLSDSEFENGKEEEQPVATKQDLKGILAKLRESGDEAELTDEELDQLLAITDAMSDKSTSDASSETDESDLSDEELNELISAAERDETESQEEKEGGDRVPVSDPRLVAVSQQHAQAIELANAQLEQQRIELTAVRAKLAAQQFETEQRTLATQYGIPPRITELARPLLEGDTGHVIQLANGDEVDAGAVMRKVLVELGSTLKALDLSALVGSGEDEPDTSEQEAQAKAAEETRNWVAAMKQNYRF